MKRIEYRCDVCGEPARLRFVRQKLAPSQELRWAATEQPPTIGQPLDLCARDAADLVVRDTRFVVEREEVGVVSIPKVTGHQGAALSPSVRVTDAR